MAGTGLGASSGVLTVNVDDSSIEINSDSLRVKESGITNAMLAGSIANDKLSNSSITIAGASTSLGGSITADTIAGQISSSTITNAQLAGSIDLTDKVTGVLPIANGGTGSSSAPMVNIICLLYTSPSPRD